MPDAKIIFTANTARKLLKMGFKIIDIKPLKENPEKTLFIFKNSEELERKLIEFRIVGQGQKPCLS